jgi:hypothetical protein
MIERLLTKMDANQAEMKADRKADREELKGMMNVTQERMDANTKSMREDIKSGQVEIRFIAGAFQEKMDACVASRRNDRKEIKSCQEPTEANTEKNEPDPGTMESVEEHQEIPKEEVAAMPVGGLRKRRRDRNLVAGRRQKPKGSNQASFGFQYEIDRRRQEDVPSCSSGTAQEKLFQKKSGPRKIVDRASSLPPPE